MVPFLTCMFRLNCPRKAQNWRTTKNNGLMRSYCMNKTNELLTSAGQLLYLCVMKKNSLLTFCFFTFTGGVAVPSHEA